MIFDKNPKCAGRSTVWVLLVGVVSPTPSDSWDRGSHVLVDLLAKTSNLLLQTLPGLSECECQNVQGGYGSWITDAACYPVLFAAAAGSRRLA